MHHDTLKSFLEAWGTSREAGHSLEGLDNVQHRTLGFRDLTDGESHEMGFPNFIAWCRRDLTEDLLPFEITSGEFKEKMLTAEGRIDLFGGV